uniref:Putative ovule protein n=1 Tax=Solanum chacoense TaxID=4108 RepID=A0A0V0GNP9_SOLCH
MSIPHIPNYRAKSNITSKSSPLSNMYDHHKAGRNNGLSSKISCTGFNRKKQIPKCEKAIHNTLLLPHLRICLILPFHSVLLMVISLAFWQNSRHLLK